MSVEQNLSEALGITHIPTKANDRIETVGQEIVPYDNAERDDQDEDYRLVRNTLRSLIQQGNDALEDITSIARNNESARGFEVVANLIKTVGETSKDLYNLQKMKRELKDPDPDSDPRKKTADSINVEQAVFVGSTAELLAAIKKQREDGKNTV